MIQVATGIAILLVLGGWLLMIVLSLVIARDNEILGLRFWKGEWEWFEYVIAAVPIITVLGMLLGLAWMVGDLALTVSVG